MPGTIESLFTEFWEWRMQDSPEFATFCGDHRHDDILDDYSLDAFQRRQEAVHEFLRRGHEIDASDLTETEQFSLELLVEDLETVLSGLKYKGFLFTVNLLEGIQVDFEQLTSWMVFQTEEDFKKYISRMQKLPRRINQVIELLREAVSLGLTQHHQAMKGVLESVSSFKAEPRTTTLMAPFQSVPEDLEGKLATLEEMAVSVIVIEIQPAFDKLGEFLETEYLPNLRPEEGVHCLPNGKEFYQECLRWHLSLDLSPEQVYQIGLEEMERIHNHMKEVIKEIGFQGDFHSFLKEVRKDRAHYYDSKNAAYNGFQAMCEQMIRPTLPKLFHRIPDSNLIIERVPDSKPNAPMAYYYAGTLDGSRPGTFFVNTHKFDSLPKYEMATLSLHEGEPGHHLQGMYAIEAQGVPAFRQYLEDMNYYAAPSRFPLHTAYVEGWGLYCEYLGKELGLYEDPYTMFGHLSYEMHRACRLVVDTGLHAMGWTYDQAVQLLLDNTALAEVFVRSEVRRYIAWPGQACAYKIGQLKLQELRTRCEEELGDEFDVRDFHDEVLRCLPVPLTMLERVIDKFIATTVTRV